MSLPRGSRLGIYEISGQIGAGGMGEVYRATDSYLKRSVAIKVLPSSVSGDAERLARFQREAEVLATLNHPNIAAIYGFERSSSLTALVMEFIDGEDLSQRIARGAIPLDEALPIAKQIADALTAAHDSGIIHRDLKPANIKLRSDGTVKVLDFGLAKALEPAAANREPGAANALANSPTITSPAMTQAGIILGTAAYMAPEQAKGKPVDKRADVWAFGCVLYELLTGTRAFSGDDVTDTIVAVLSKDVDFSRLPASTPAGVRRVLARCLVKDRNRRLREIGDVHHDLSDDTPAVASTITAASPTRPSRYLLWGAVTALGILAVLLALPAMSHWSEPARVARPLRLTIDAPPQAARLLTPEISPDGRSVAFSALSARPVPELWIRELNSAAPTMVADAPTPNGPPFWSPDGRLLVYPATGELVQLDLASNTVRSLTKISTTLGGVTRFSGSWGSQGVILYGVESSIYRVPTAGGDSTAVTFEGLPEKSDNRLPAFLPDGRRFLFLSGAPGESHTYLASLDGGPVTRLFEAESQATYTEPQPGRGFVLYVLQGNLLAQPFDLRSARPNGTAFVVARSVPTTSAGYAGTGRGAFSVSADGVLVYLSQPDSASQQLTWLDRAGKAMGTVGPPGLYFNPRVAPDGRRVVVGKLDPRTLLGDVYVLDERGNEQRLTFDPGDDRQPVWTPDGTHVIWAAERSGKYLIVRKRADGGGPEEVLHESPDRLIPDDVSPDGRTLVFGVSKPATLNDLWVLPLDGSGPARPLLATPADEPRARFSPDGRLIGYISDGQSLIGTFPDLKTKWQVAARGSVPQWRRDGKEVFLAGGSVTTRSVLETMPLRLGEPIVLFTHPVVQRGSFFHASPDGQRFLFALDLVQASTLRYQVAIDWAP